jgi:uncharacterized protein
MKDEESRSIENLANALKQKTGADLAVVTINTIAPYGTIEEYALNLFNAWGIGQKGQDDGVLLILAMEERKVKIETGYGLEGAIPDSMAGRILDNAVLPLFKKNNFSKGLLLGAQAIAAAVARDKGISPEEIEQIGVSASAAAAINRKGKGLGTTIAILLPFIIFIVFISIGIVVNKKRGRRGGYYGGGISRPGSGRPGSGFSGNRPGGGGRSGGGGASRSF